MDTKFLQSLRVGEQPLPKEVVDAILVENQRDVEAAKKPFLDYEAIKEQLAAAKEGLKAFEGVDVRELQGQVAKLTKDLEDKEAAHRTRLAELEFEGVLKAIRALLDVDALRQSKNQEADIRTALEGLKKESGYLFEEEKTAPPPYAAGTGSAPVGGGKYSPQMAAIRSAAGLKND